MKFLLDDLNVELSYIMVTEFDELARLGSRIYFSLRSLPRPKFFNIVWLYHRTLLERF
jgi:hypothetical protein